MTGVDTATAPSEQTNSRTRTPVAAQSPTVPRQGSNGQRIGPYVLGKTLGVGSTGRVKLGVHIETNQRVAIKIISKEMLDPNLSDAKKAEGSKKLEREITIMKLIHHPNVLQLYDVYETNKELFLVLEMVEGGELFDYLVKKGRLNETEAVGFFQQIIMGVEFCHRHLICHRDLKPENLLLDKERNVKIADFGMASLQVPSKMLETSCGSPHYASPEIIRGIRYDGPSADIWSCGVILYALVTGNLPFDDENIRRLLNKVKTGLFYIPEFVSPDAKDLIKRMLVVDPAKRISMAEIMRHPWFTSRPLKPTNRYIPSALETDTLTKVIPNAPKLEEDILESLNLLGWTDKNQLITSLNSEGPNVEKVFYNLLHKRKWDMFEHYDAEKGGQYDSEDGPRRRTESYTSVDRPPKTTQSTEELRLDSPSTEQTPLSPLSAGGPSQQRRAVSDTHRARQAIASVRVNSPLATSITPSNLKTEVKADGSGDVLSGKQAAPASPITSPRDSTAPSPSKKKPLTISIPATGPTAAQQQASSNLAASNAEMFGSKENVSTPRSPVVTQALMAMGLGTPKFHRKGVNQSEIPATPIITSAPKQSWFQSLFNFKPDPFIVSSTKNMDETLQMVLTTLSLLEVKFQLRKDGLVKCKFEPPNNSGSARNSIVSPMISPETRPILPPLQQPQQQASPMASPVHDKSSRDNGNLDPPASPAVTGKSVKFKIEFIVEQKDDNEKRDIIRIQFTHQQGAFSTFQTVVDRFQQRWSQDNLL